MPPSQASPVYDAYWQFAAARQDVYLRRLAGAPPPWTSDPIISSWRFTNPYRAADRVSQYLIRHVIYCGPQDAHEVLFRILLFRWFNRIDTWELLLSRFGELNFQTFEPCVAVKALNDAKLAGRRVYSPAYIVPPVPGSSGPKHAGHIDLTIRMITGGLHETLQQEDSLQGVFQKFRSWPGIGNFLAYQLAIDINYSNVVDHDEDDFVVPGPGALDGISKAWPAANLQRAADIVRRTADEQEDCFDRLGLQFPGLFGRRLKLIDCQNLYCEISKYSRLSHPDVIGVSGRTRIKQKFQAASFAPLPRPYFPPKWNLRIPNMKSAPTAEKIEPYVLDLDLSYSQSKAPANLAESYGS